MNRLLAIIAAFASLLIITSPGAVAEEIGTNDFRISTMGADGSANWQAFYPQVVFNSTQDEFFVVWSSADGSGGLVVTEYEIWGQRIGATTGELVGSRIRISDMGPDGDPLFDASRPRVAFNSARNEYLVVWYGDDNSGALIEGEFEIFGQRIDAATGTEVGTNDFRISDMGPNSNSNYVAFTPSVAYNAQNDSYLVVWYGDDNTAPLVDDEYEIFGQRLDGDGTEIGTNDIRLSDLGPNGNTNYSAVSPVVAYDSVNNQYLVVWHGDDNTAPLVDNEQEIFGQFINAETGDAVGTNDFRISDAGTDGITNYAASNAGVTYNSQAQEFLVVWSADDDTGALTLDEFEIYGQRINASSRSEVGDNDFRISDMGNDGDASADAKEPSVTYNYLANEYFVTWRGDDQTGGPVDDEDETYGQRLTGADGTAIGPNDFRLSQIGTDGDATTGVSYTAAAVSNSNRYLAVFSGDDDTAPLINQEFEIYGQLYRPFAADLSATVSDSPDPVSPGSTLTYIIQLANLGADDHSSPISADLTLPNGVTFGSSTGALSCSETGGLVTCNLDQLASSSSVSAAIEVTVGGSTEGALAATLAITTDVSATDDNAGNNTGSASTTASPDTDGDGLVNSVDTDDDDDGLADATEAVVGTDPLDSDSDNDGFLDGQEYGDGSSPLDPGSFVSSLHTTFCSEWNGFLGGMYNIQEFVNLSSSSRNVTTTLYSLDGAAQGNQLVPVLAGAQTDLLVHDMTGWTLNTYGKTCSTHDGAAGDVDGRMVYYKPNATGYDFAFAMPYQNGLSGEQFVPFNTFQPSLDSADASNLVTNWIQITNLESTAQTGRLYYYGQDGTELAQDSVSLDAESRQDFSGHQFGTNLVGTIRWVPTSGTGRFQLRNVRYYYDNIGTADSFDSAFQLEGARGNGQTIWAPLDTSSGSAILEVANTTGSAVTAMVSFYGGDGSLRHTVSVPLAAYGSQHLIADSIISSQLGSASIGSTGVAGSLIATAMHYGRTTTAGITWIYGIAAHEAFGSNLRGSYNSFLGQSCELVLVNSDATAHDATLSMTRYDGTSVVAGQVVSVPAHGSSSVNICASDSADVYGVVTVQPATANTIYATVVRHGANDDYRFPTPVRE